MTREEIFSQLYSSQEVYRPPLEQGSALLEVTAGCSYGKCRFCDFRRDGFRAFAMDEIERKVKLLSLVIGDNPRLHFLGCNPFALPEERLMAILELTGRYLPGVREVSMYARADDILRKGGGALARLRRAGVAELHVGLESGCEQVLSLHDKGETAAQIEQALSALSGSGIRYHLTAIPGLGGRELSRPHAEETAALISRLCPLSIWCIALKVWPDTPLHRMVEEGSFQPLTPLEILREEQDMIRAIRLELPCLYVDSSVLNRYTVMGMLPESKEGILSRMELLAERELEAQ